MSIERDLAEAVRQLLGHVDVDRLAPTKKADAHANADTTEPDVWDSIKAAEEALAMSDMVDHMRRLEPQTGYVEVFTDMLAKAQKREDQYRRDFQASLAEKRSAQ